MYLKERGLPPDEIGIIGALQPFAGALGSPLFAFVADYFGIHRWVLVCCMVVSVLVRATLTVAPSFWTKAIVVLYVVRMHAR